MIERVERLEFVVTTLRGAVSSDCIQQNARAAAGSVESHDVIECEVGTCLPHESELICEEPLLISIEGKPYSTVMRTPGEETFHAAGLCLAEGLVDEPDDIITISYCDQRGGNVARVTLRPERREKISALLERRTFVSQTSCGICGKELIQDLCQNLTVSTDETQISISEAMECVAQLSRYQKLYEKTHSTHAALLFDAKLQFLAVAEDVGRHNALDKAIGKAFIGGKLTEASLGVLSSRISYELVQKAGRAHVAILIGMSRPTALAVELGRSINMTLACMGENGRLLVYCGEERLSL